MEISKGCYVKIINDIERKSFFNVDICGWTGVVIQSIIMFNCKTLLKIRLDNKTITSLPIEYTKLCANKQLLYDTVYIDLESVELC